MSGQNNVSIDGKEYDLTDLSVEAKEQLNNIQLTDQELQRLQVQTAITQTARNAYAQALKNALSAVKADDTKIIG